MSIAEIIETRRNWNCTQSEEGDFVFAGESLQIAYAYAFKTAGCLMQSDNTVIYASKSELENAGAGFIYALRPKNFEPVIDEKGKFAGEWLARKNIHLSEDGVGVIHVCGIEQAMKEGVNFLYFAENKRANIRCDHVAEDITKLLKGGVLKEFTAIDLSKPSRVFTA
jgi:hypothetical protein